jgi:flagellar basal-body rod modification protein FlgD
MSVMGMKDGTKTWQDAGQLQNNPKGDLQQTQLTDAQKQMLGDENIGNVLNKVSDKNWVDPSKKVQGSGSSKMDKDAFFKLMLAQLKNQDPSNPLKNHEMAAQLAQFSTLEQMTNVNTTLTEIKGASKPVEQFQALNLIGKLVAGDSSKIVRTDLDSDHDFKFKLPMDVKQADVKVMNAKGDIVRQYKFNELKSGENEISWNGNDDKGRKAPAGNYTFQISATGVNGQRVQPKTDFEGVISGMSFSPDGPIIQVGKQSVRLKDIRQFSDPSLTMNDQKSNNITDLDLKKADAVKHTVNKEEEKTAEQKRAMSGSTEDVLTNVSMEGGLLNKVKEAMNKTSDTESTEAKKPTAESETSVR